MKCGEEEATNTAEVGFEKKETDRMPTHNYNSMNYSWLVETFPD